MAAFLAGAVWLLDLTQTIVLPVIPPRSWRPCSRRGVRRGLATAIVCLLMGGARRPDESQGWLEDLGVSASSAESAKEDASASVSDGFHALLDGVSTGIDALASLVMFLSFTALSLVFLLKDGPASSAFPSRDRSR